MSYNKGQRSSARLAKYGVTQAWFEETLAAQGGVCAICRQPETRVLRGKVTDLCVDHDHATGAVRGLLCNACNAMLGCFDDDPDRLIAAAEYIEADAERMAAGG